MVPSSLAPLSRPCGQAKGWQGQSRAIAGVADGTVSHGQGLPPGAGVLLLLVLVSLHAAREVPVGPSVSDIHLLTYSSPKMGTRGTPGAADPPMLAGCCLPQPWGVPP